MLSYISIYISANQRYVQIVSYQRFYNKRHIKCHYMYMSCHVTSFRG